jgi:hypothetical protein
VKPLVLHGAVTLFVVAIALAIYDRLVVLPSQRIGVVDLAEVYRAKEAQFSRLLTTSGSDADRHHAMALAAEFAQRLPVALEELPRECRCLVVVKASVVGSAPQVMDLTPALKRKVDL